MALQDILRTTNEKVAAGDPFPYAGAKRRPDTQETPHGCYEGWIYLGFEGEDENGEHVEEIERVPCRRCWSSPSDDDQNL